MFFTECAILAERHPNLAAAVQKIDTQLRRMGTAEVIRVDDFASFLGIDPNQAGAVLAGLAETGFLRAEEVVECADCGMVALRSDYCDALEEGDEYRCTSCNCPMDDETVQAITTYRRGEKWKVEAPVAPGCEEGTETGRLIDPAQNHGKNVRAFRNQGKTWLLVYDGVTKTVNDMVGMKYISRLLQIPGQDTHAAALRGLVAGESGVPLLGSAGDMVDGQALKAYREHIEDLEEQLREAEDNNDVGRAQRLKEQLEAVTTEIARATGLGGRSRKAADDREKARQAVSVAMRRAMKAIKKEHGPLWQHLRNSLKIGEFLSYRPDNPTTWIT